MMLKDMDELRDIAGNCADRDGAWDYDGEPALRKWVEAKIAEAQAAERERCAEAFAGFCRSSERKIRSLSPDPNWLERERLERRLFHHTRLNEQRTYGYHDPITHMAGAKRPIECSTCERIADLERRLQESQAKETKP
jgi:hypothetical protein